MAVAFLVNLQACRVERAIRAGCQTGHIGRDSLVTLKHPYR